MTDTTERVGAAVIIKMTGLIGTAAWDALKPETRARVKDEFGSAAIEAHKASLSEQGLVIVPREPVAAMVDAATPGDSRIDTYKAMITAALGEE